jgi:hypothetical protein
MSTQPVAAERLEPRTLAWPWVPLSYLAVGLAALLPRVLGLGVFLSGDESEFWLRRSQIFLDALGAHNWLATAVTTHPGVTTMWLGSAGLLLRDALDSAGLLTNPSFPAFLTIMRLPAAIVHAAALLGGYAMLRRMLAPGAALLAALLWATDPFVIAFSRVLHTDALAGTFITLSLLAACLYWHHDRRARWLIGSGVAAGLAILSKSPSLALLPWVGLVAAYAEWNREPKTKDQETSDGSRFLVLGSRERSFAGQWRPLVLGLLMWGAVCAATVFALWPALWVSPLSAYDQVRLGVEAEGAQPHMLGNFFLGREDDAPGPLFYPVALALRLTPWAMLGLFALAVAWRRGRAPERRDLAALAGFALLFILAMTLFPKKFNRYIMPTFPAIDILAAWGLYQIADFRLQIGDWIKRQSAVYNLQAAVVSAVALVAIANVAWWHPYEMVYFNQALGGARVGANTFTTGWGEGLSEAAGWLNQQPDITGVVTLSTMVNGLQEYMRKGAQVTGQEGPLPPKAGYVVVYVRNIQWGRPWQPFDDFYGQEVPLHVVKIHGVEYAWIYRVPPPVAERVGATFGDNMRLRGLDLKAPAHPGQPLTYQLFWKTGTAPQNDYMLFLHLIGDDGRTYARSDQLQPASGWGSYKYLSTEAAVPLPADLPAGSYRLVAGLYDPQTGQRLPLSAGTAATPALDGPNAVVLTTVQIGR